LTEVPLGAAINGAGHRQECEGEKVGAGVWFHGGYYGVKIRLLCV
jgi:hypothetical protein